MWVHARHLRRGDRGGGAGVERGETREAHRVELTSAGRGASTGRAAKIAGKSTGGNPHCVTRATARDRRSRLHTSAVRKRVLIWMASAPSRAQAKIAAR